MKKMSAYQQWPSDTSNAVHATDETGVDRSLSKGDRIRYDEDGSGKDAGSAETSNGAPQNEGDRRRGRSTEGTADLEDEDGDEVDRFDGEERVQLQIGRAHV